MMSEAERDGARWAGNFNKQWGGVREEVRYRGIARRAGREGQTSANNPPCMRLCRVFGEGLAPVGNSKAFPAERDGARWAGKLGEVCRDE